MRTLIGAVVVAIGMLLAIYGLDATECLTTRVSRALHTHPAHHAIWFLAGGLAFILVGMALAFRNRRLRA